MWISAKERAFVHRLYSDPKVQELRGASAYSSVAEAEEQIWQWRKMFAEQNGIRWAIYHREAQVMIGTVGLKNISKQHLTAEISYELIPGWWNLGIMTEVLTKICDYALSMSVVVVVVCATTDGDANLRRSIAQVEVSNVDLRICEPLGPECAAFGGGATIWSSPEERDAARALCVEIGTAVSRPAPLGFDGQGLLVVFPNTCPNNTLPILHASSLLEGRRPLFPRPLG